jgi:CHAD domain-containing protein
VVEQRKSHTADASAEALLLARLRRLRSELECDAAQVCAGTEGSVHRMRITARRLRSVVTTFEPLLAAGSVAGLRDDLRWLGASLSSARDAQVLRERFATRLASLAPELVVGGVAADLAAGLCAASHEGSFLARGALRSDRYLEMLEDLDDLIAAPPVRRCAHGPARRVLPRLLRKDARRVRRAADQASHADTAQRDERMHELRKKVKRLRYAAETAAPVYPPASRVMRRATDLQEVLGLRQDAVVAGHQLERFAALAEEEERDVSTYALLRRLEEGSVARADGTFDRAWSRLARAVRVLDD